MKKKIFYIALIVFSLFELLTNYLLMDFPGSQNLNSIDFAHTLWLSKIYIELFLVSIILYAAMSVFSDKGKIKPVIFILLAMLAYYFSSCWHTAENIFRQPAHLNMKPMSTSTVPHDMMVIGVEHNGEAKAYPLPYIVYHHQIMDSVGGKQYITTFCQICHTGRTYEPYINGVYTKFRLVGILHHNATLEDEMTKSWWSQQSGECIAGKLKGQWLTEVHSNCMTLQQWAALYPNTLVMQPDPTREGSYLRYDYFIGNARHPMIHNKDNNWDKHTFVVGAHIGNTARAYQWNDLEQLHIINDTLAQTPLLFLMANDKRSFAVFKNPTDSMGTWRNDTLFLKNIPYNLAGINLLTSKKELEQLNAYREYWFTWQFANPTTTKYLMSDH